MVRNHGVNECREEKTSVPKSVAFVDAETKTPNAESEKENRLTAGKISFCICVTKFTDKSVDLDGRSLEIYLYCLVTLKSYLLSLRVAFNFIISLV